MEKKETKNKNGLRPGDIIADKYILGEVLGQGGFGITYSGKRIEDGKKVAIKEYCPISRGENIEEFEKGKQRFLQEAEILKEFRYLDGIVSVWDYFETSGTACIVMEYIEGITLKKYIQENGCLPIKELLELSMPVMHSLIQIHRRGLVHRDISPDNLMIGLDNKMRLIDFGAARATNEQEQKTMTVILKSGYAPPEQYLVDGKQGAWTDVYALAATMYTALCGKVPPESVRRLQENGTMSENEEWIEVLENTAVGLKEWQRRAIEKAMCMSVAKRYRDVEQFLNAITEQPSLEQTVTVRPSNIVKEKNLPSKELNQFSRESLQQRKRSYIFGALICVLMIIFIVGWQMTRRDVESLSEKMSEVSSQSSENFKEQRPEEVSVAAIEDTPEKTDTEKLAKMPDVTGRTLKQARKKIREQDSEIQIQVKRKYDDFQKKGVVLRQNVVAGTRYNVGTIEKIVLTVSKGKKKQKKESTKSSSNIVSQPKRQENTSNYGEFTLGE